MSWLTGYAPLNESPAPADVLLIVDTSDHSMASTGTDKYMTVAELLALALPALAQVSVTASGTLAVNALTEVTAASGALTMTLPASVAGDLIVVERASASTANVAVTGNIRGVAAQTVTLQLGSESEGFLGFGGSWWPMFGHKTLSSLDARYMLLAGATLAGWFAPSVVALTDGASIAVNAAAGNDFRVTLGGSRQLANPTNPVDGQTISVSVTQDGTGSRLLSYGTAYEFSTSLPSPVLSTTPGYTDVLAFRYYASKSKWLFVGFVNGFA